MRLNNTNIDSAITEVEALLESETSISPALKAAIKVIITLVSVLAISLGLNSKNSSKPPSSDPNRERGSNKEKSTKKPGGQNGHIGTRLNKVDNPDKIETIELDQKNLPKGKYKEVGYEARQVIDIEISTIVTEYRAQILEDERGKRFVAPFPEGIKCEIQYGKEVKTHAIYMSQFQMPISKVSVMSLGLRERRPQGF